MKLRPIAVRDSNRATYFGPHYALELRTQFSKIDLLKGNDLLFATKFRII